MTKSKATSEGVLVLGVAREEINPPMEGREIVYPHRYPATGVESDLCVRAMVFGSPDMDRPQAALAVFDTLYMHPPIAAAVRREAARLVPGLPPEAIMLAATHTHSAPPLMAFDMTGRGWAGRVALRPIGQTGTMAEPDPQYVEKVIASAARAIARAWQSRHSVRAAIGLTEARLAQNRRVVDPDGKATNEWTDPEGRHTGYCDPRIRFVVFRDAADDRVRAILCGYGCHPVTFGPEGGKPSPDYPGYFVRKLEAATGALLAMHVTTGGANINPRRGLDNTGAQTRVMGEALADAVLASLDHTLPLETSPIVAATAPLELTLRATMGKGPAELLVGRVAAGQKTVRTEVQALRVGNLALVSAPGELFAELVVAVENLSPLAHTLVVGHANDALGYLFPESAGREGGYEVTNGSASASVERPFLAAACRALAEVAKAGG